MNSKKTLKILMLEDSKDDTLLIERALHKGGLTFVSLKVDTSEEFSNAIKQFHPDVILSDNSLPQFNSIEALKFCLREKAIVPFILVTGSVTSAIHRALKRRKLEALKRNARRALRKQNEELLKVNKELDSFVYSLSHNLRGPLASMKGLLNLAELKDRSETLENIHSMIASGVSELDNTLNELRDHSNQFQKQVDAARIIRSISREILLEIANPHASAA
jgi:CheY-like chemotaxis protein